MSIPSYNLAVWAKIMCSELTIKDEFREITVRSDSGEVVIDLSSIKQSGLKLSLIVNNDVFLLSPAKEQDSTQKALNFTLEPLASQIGHVLEDGWIVAGFSPNNGMMFSIEPPDSALQGEVTWFEGSAHAIELRSMGHESARLPSKDELNVIYNNLVKGGHENVTGLGAGSHWSSSPSSCNIDRAWCQNLDVNNEHQGTSGKYNTLSARCVRNEP